jgi:hypothetical protein
MLYTVRRWCLSAPVVRAFPLLAVSGAVVVTPR